MNFSVIQAHSEFTSEYSPKLYTLLYNLGFITGCINSDVWLMWIYKYSIHLLWVFFTISFTLMSLIKAPNIFILTYGGSILGYYLSSMLLAILLITELKHIISITKIYPRSYYLPLLLTLNKVPSAFDFITHIYYYKYLFIGICIIACIGISMKFDGKNKLVISPSGKNNYLPFFVVIVPCYLFGISCEMNLLIKEKFVSDSDWYDLTSTLVYLSGLYFYTILYRNNKEWVVICMLFILPICSVLFFSIGWKFFNEMEILYTAGYCTFSLYLGLLEIKSLKLIILNSSFPEFFLGMFYFLSKMSETIFYILMKIYLDDNKFYDVTGVFLICVTINMFAIGIISKKKYRPLSN
jgi:hypothetical protein